VPSKERVEWGVHKLHWKPSRDCLRPCKASTTEKEPCPYSATRGSTYCYHHDKAFNGVPVCARTRAAWNGSLPVLASGRNAE
jgi:hypothetical protein